MSDFVLLTQLSPTGGDAGIFVNLDRVTMIRARGLDGSTVVMIAADGSAASLDVIESPRDIIALANLERSFAAARWREELGGELSEFHSPRAGQMSAALVEGETGGLAKFAFDDKTGDWTFQGIEEPTDVDVHTTRLDARWNQKRSATEQPPPGVADAYGSDRERLEGGARRALNRLSSRNAAGTSNGKLACAWAVNEIALESLGRRIGGGLSTIRMYEALRASADIVLGSPLPGDIVISPTRGRAVGHVGIVLEVDGRIASNSSSRALFVQNYTLATWKTAFVVRKNLEMHLFRIRDAPA